MLLRRVFVWVSGLGPVFMRLHPYQVLFGNIATPQVDKACALTKCVVQLLTYPFILRILAAKPCFYGTTLLVCDTGSPRASASDRPSSSVQGSPAPCLPAHPKAPEERTRELGVMTVDHAHHACTLERTRPCEY
jgi:hypothetical protein